MSTEPIIAWAGLKSDGSINLGAISMHKNWGDDVEVEIRVVPPCLHLNQYFNQKACCNVCPDCKAFLEPTPPKS